MTIHDALRGALKTLRLSGVAQSLELRLQEAMERSLSHQEFLELILEDELAVRQDRAFSRRLRAAEFRDLKTLEDFDWSFNPSINKQQIYALASGRVIQERRDALLVGPPGVGKSHLVQAAGYALLRAGFSVWYRSIFDAVHELKHDEAFENHEKIMVKYLKPDLLILDDMGMKQLPPRSGEYLFEIIMRRYERRSTFLTTNRPLEDWGKLVGDVPAASAILDRLLHHAQIITMTGRSYRLNEKIRSEGSSKKSSPSAKASESLGESETQPSAKPGGRASSAKSSSRSRKAGEGTSKTGQSAHRVGGPARRAKKPK